MSEAARPLRAIVVAHGSLAEGLVDAARQVAGDAADALVPLSNRGLSPAELAARIRELATPGPALIFTDLPGGSCGVAARRLCREWAGLAVIAGVNLPLLLEFLLLRDLPLDRLVARLLEKGRAAICCAPAASDAPGRAATG